MASSERLRTGSEVLVSQVRIPSLFPLPLDVLKMLIRNYMRVNAHKLLSPERQSAAAAALVGGKVA